MRRIAVALSAAASLTACVEGPAGPPGPAGPAGDKWAFTCPPDSVRSGTVCIDTYEASVWQTTAPAVIAKIRDGTVTLADLTAAGATQFGFAPLGYGSCGDGADGCENFYAVSLAGVPPSRFMTWFQAVVFTRNAHKRLPTNQEWQAAAHGTPDPGVSAAGSADCNTANGGGAGVPLAVPTGSRASCVSDVGAFDMVGNVEEWVADWVPRSKPPCLAPMFPNDDWTCLVGVLTFPTETGPGALIRGGAFDNGTKAGLFAMTGLNAPSARTWTYGFRGAR